MATINAGDNVINETQVDGTELARRLERLYSVVHSQNSNATRPPYIKAGGVWSKTIEGGFDLIMYDGFNDQKICSVINGVAYVGGWIKSDYGACFPSGNLLVGSSSNSGNAKLNVLEDVNNVAYFHNAAGTGIYLTSGGTTWLVASDERLKTTLTPFADSVEKICSLRSGVGRYLTDKEDVKRPFLIAQDVQKILPEAVHVQDNKEKTLSLGYTDLIPLIVSAIQEQQTMINELKAKVAAVEAVIGERIANL